MGVDNVEAQIEEDLAWRCEEIAFFSAQLNNFRPLDISDQEKKRVEDEKNRFRKALVLILYAHFEGFFRYSFALYVKTLNEAGISLSEAIDVLVAASLHEEFNDYDNVKQSVAQENVEMNKAVRSLKNRVKWIQKFDKLRQENAVKLPISEKHNDKNSIVYTEYNLSFDIIQKFLYRLGFSDENINEILNQPVSDKKFKDVLNEFLGRRNAIAHGASKKGVNEKEYNEFSNLFEKVMNRIPLIT